MWRRAWTLAVLLVVLVAASARASHEVDEGWVDVGVSSEDEARAYPCPRTAAGGWERTGPVVCLDKVAPDWELWSASRTGCTHDATGWHGDCVFDLDMGDHVRVWGTRGVVSVRFTVTWLHGDASDPTPTPSTSPTATPTPSPTPTPTSTPPSSSTASPTASHDPAPSETGPTPTRVASPAGAPAPGPSSAPVPPSVSGHTGVDAASGEVSGPRLPPSGRGTTSAPVSDDDARPHAGSLPGRADGRRIPATLLAVTGLALAGSAAAVVVRMRRHRP